jgi:hypothetical protein
LSSSSEDTYDWTFDYNLSRPVFCKESSEDYTIKFVKDSYKNLIGFKIGVNNKTESKAREKSEIKKRKLERVLTILSGIELKAIPAGAEGVPRKPGLRRVYNVLTVEYDTDGSIDNINMIDNHIGNIINRGISPELDRELCYLSDAVAHKSHGRFSESIKEAFRVIDEKHYSTSIRDYHECIKSRMHKRYSFP